MNFSSFLMIFIKRKVSKLHLRNANKNLLGKVKWKNTIKRVREKHEKIPKKLQCKKMVKKRWKFWNLISKFTLKQPCCKLHITHTLNGKLIIISKTIILCKYAELIFLGKFLLNSCSQKQKNGKIYLLVSSNHF